MNFQPDIRCGDNVQLMKQLPPDTVDLVVTSPPYDSVKYDGSLTWDFYGVCHQLYRVIKPGGIVVWVVQNVTQNMDENGSAFVQAIGFKLQGFKLYHTLIYSMPIKPLMGNKYRYYRSFNYMFVFSKGRPKTLNLLHDVPTADGRLRKRSDIWRPKERSTRFLDTLVAFPLELVTDHIKSWSNPGDVVLDPFLGSCTTCLAAKTLQRQSIGFELFPDRYKVATERCK